MSKRSEFENFAELVKERIDLDRDAAGELLLITPAVHLGGTCKHELMRVRSEFSRALRTAITALENMSPHMRDYRECIGGSVPTFSEAVKQHRRRFLALQMLLQEIENEQWALAGRGGE
jgi:hypothetical protein